MCCSRSVRAAGSGIADLIPGSDYFQLYTVTSGFPEVPPDYHLVVDGLVDKPLSLTVADLEAMPPTKLVRDFQCVTGWRVPGVHWTGVQLGSLVGPAQGWPRRVRRSFSNRLTAFTPKASLWTRRGCLT